MPDLCIALQYPPRSGVKAVRIGEAVCGYREFCRIIASLPESPEDLGLFREAAKIRKLLREAGRLLDSVAELRGVVVGENFPLAPYRGDYQIKGFCRVGSLENRRIGRICRNSGFCRVGSLERAVDVC